MFMVYFHHDKANEIIYIGKTKNEETRPESHKNKKWWNESKYITYAECENEIDMDIYEIYYINVYKPKYNVAKKYISYPTIQLPDLKFKSYDELKKQLQKNIKKRKDLSLTGNKVEIKKSKWSRAARKSEEDKRLREMTEERNKSQTIHYYIEKKPELLLALRSPASESFTLDGKTEFGIRNSAFKSLPEDSVKLFNYIIANGTIYNKDEYGYLQIDLYYHDYLMAFRLEDTKETELKIIKILDEFPKMHLYEFTIGLPTLKVITLQGKLFVSGLIPVQRTNGIVTMKICIKFYYDFLSKYFQIPTPIRKSVMNGLP